MCGLNILVLPTDNQSLVVVNGQIYDAGLIIEEQWDSNLEEHKLRDEDFPEPGNVEDIPVIGNDEDEMIHAQEKRPSLAGYIFVLCGVLICGAAIVIILIIVFIVRKRSKPLP